MTKYTPIIGMEVHCELKTNSKMFCSCPNGLGLEAEPNIHICPVCLAHPGALPTMNLEAVKMVIKVGLALGADIPTISKFDRKNYFYPDLSKGYQISQYDQPLTKNGKLTIGDKVVRITRVHLEEDTGKLIHPDGASYSLVDFNRAGVPLMELVTEPDITSAAEAKKFCQELQLLLRAIGVSDADMEKGQMRCEANISLMPAGLERVAKNFGTKVEVKNLNSFKAVERAIEYEIKRQDDLLATGEKIIQETRGWDENKNQTYSQRTKESAHDYRYFPEPDLAPLWLSTEPPPGDSAHYIKIDVEEIRRTLPELPQAKRQRFQTEYALNTEAATLLISDPAIADYTEKVFSELIAWLSALESVEGTAEEIIERERAKLGKLVAGWITTELFKLLNEAGQTARDLKITPENFAEFLTIVYQNKINSSAAQVLLREMFLTGKDPSAVLEEKDLKQIDDSASLDAVVERVISLNPGPANDYKKGKENALQYLVGQAMKETKGKANPQKLQELFRNQLKS
ncbi:glutaminyl-tRNA synthase (glutamine-hydrolyzing) subunit B [Candidatus Uhrbacteria bacterium RIFCSPLOWO2_12_FULL_46_10]|nr:MAG: glutaminyl-tRNA synthase (glutamine-hydrolyzing) subunit B [Candidatus Uhrbacteria bacterium RIFCSPLOWO2_12_FULL_46_10]